MKRVILFTFEGNKYLESVKDYFIGKNVEFEVIVGDKSLTDAETFDLGVVWGHETELPKCLLENIPFIRVQPSLLPKFNTKSAIEDNFYSNDKYGGVTIHYLNYKEKFLTQESFWKEDAAVLEEFKEQVFEIASRLLPRVIEDILYKKINVLILTDKIESDFYKILWKSSFINNLYSEDAESDFLQKYSAIEIDLCLFDKKEAPSTKLLNQCLEIGIMPITVSYQNYFPEKNICIWDGKNKLELFDNRCDFDCVLQKTNLKQIIVNNFDISDLGSSLDSDSGEILIKTMLQKLDYTFLHWKK